MSGWPGGNGQRASRGRGAFIALAGIDGSGKSTQAGLLRKKLTDLGYQAYLFEGKEDFAVQVMRAIASEAGESIRGYFGEEGVDLAKAFDTLRDVTYLTRPLTARGTIVVQPRSGYCRIALAMSMGSSNVEQVERVTHFAGEPDLTLWLDTPVEVCLDRIEKRGIDSEDPSMLRRFRDAMATLHRRHPEWIRIDAARSIETVQGELSRHVTEWLDRSRPELIRQETEAVDG